MVPTPDGTGVVLIGGYHARKDLYELICTSNSCNWNSLDQKLSVNRFQSVAIAMDVDCEP
jgi:hypothetical protein